MIKVYAVYAQINSETWRLASVSALSSDRARSLAEQEQLRPGSAFVNAPLAVRMYDSIQVVPWQLVDAA